MHLSGKSRPFNLFRNLAFLGLAACIFTWGLQYKLSLYDPSQAASHQIPSAKLLSKNEQSRATDSPRVIQTKTSAKVLFAAPASVFFVLLLVLGKLNAPASGQREQRANRSWHLRRAIVNAFFVRPPPVLV
jgi:hypothetical protein